MATLWIPAVLRDLTGGNERVEVAGQTVRELLANLDQQYPGASDRFLRDGQLRPGLAVVIDSQFAKDGIDAPVPAGAEVHLIPAIAGG